MKLLPAVAARASSPQALASKKGRGRSVEPPYWVNRPLPASSVEEPPVSVTVYAPDGSLLTAPEPRTSAAPTALQRAEELLRRGHNVVHCRHSRFASDYKPYESIGETVARNLAAIGLYNPAVKEAVEQRQVRIRSACDE